MFLLENPRDRGAWCAAVYGVTQSLTRLRRLSSSSRRYFPVTAAEHPSGTTSSLINPHPKDEHLSYFQSSLTFEFDLEWELGLHQAALIRRREMGRGSQDTGDEKSRNDQERGKQ